MLLCVLKFLYLSPTVRTKPRPLAHLRSTACAEPVLSILCLGLLASHAIGIRHLHGNLQRLVIQLCLRDKSPYLSNQDRPEEEHGDDGGDGLLPEDTHTGFESHVISFGDKGDMKGSTHAENGFERSTFGDGNVVSATVQTVGIYLVSIVLEFALNTRGHDGYEGGCAVYSLFGIESSHSDSIY